MTSTPVRRDSARGCRCNSEARSAQFGDKLFSEKRAELALTLKKRLINVEDRCGRHSKSEVHLSKLRPFDEMRENERERSRLYLTSRYPTTRGGRVTMKFHPSFLFYAGRESGLRSR